MTDSTTKDERETGDRTTPHADEGLLRVRGLRKAFRDAVGGRVEVLREISFEAAPGETLAVVGASGSGKSTLLHVLGGLEAADGGSARLGPHELTDEKGARQARLRNRELAFVFQFHHLLTDLTAVENVALPLWMARTRRAEALRAANEMLERVGLKDRARHTVGELSGGEQQRVAVARALVTRPRLVLADEPTGNLDERTGAQIGALLFSAARERGAILVVATHNAELARACDRQLLLHDGRLHDILP